MRTRHRFDIPYERQEQMIGAEVEHDGKDQRAGAKCSAACGSALRGYRRTPRAGYRHRAAHDRSSVDERSLARGLALVGFAKACRPERRRFRSFSTKRSAMASQWWCCRGCCHQSENAVLVVINRTAMTAVGAWR